MKKLFFFILALSLASTWTVNAQTMDYYTGKSSVKGDGYEYKVVFETKYKVPMMFLRNVNNTRFDARQYWPNGDVVGYDAAYAARFIDVKQGVKAFRQVFSLDEIAAMKRVKGLSIAMEYIVSTEDGSVIEVEFHMEDNSIFKSINPDKFHLLELKLKESVKFTIDSGQIYRSLGYIKGRANTIYIDDL